MNNNNMLPRGMPGRAKLQRKVEAHSQTLEKLGCRCHWTFRSLSQVGRATAAAAQVPDSQRSSSDTPLLNLLPAAFRALITELQAHVQQPRKKETLTLLAAAFAVAHAAQKLVWGTLDHTNVPVFDPAFGAMVGTEPVGLAEKRGREVHAVVLSTNVGCNKSSGGKMPCTDYARSRSRLNKAPDGSTLYKDLDAKDRVVATCEKRGCQGG